MATISLCMIVKNEEEVLDRCLLCVTDLVDEIIVVDTGSEDITRQIALKYTAQVYDFPWTDDFSAARNFAFSKASMEYCMWLDADDVIGEEDRAAFLKLKKELSPDTDMVMMRYNTGFDNTGKPTFWYYRERLIRNGRGYLWQGAVHEVITPSGNVIYSDTAVCHKKAKAGDPDRNLNIYSRMLSQGKKLDARETYYYARELYYHGQYETALNTFQVFLTMSEAWIENKIEACAVMSKCFRETGEPSASLAALFKSMEFDVPRAEICCEIGAHFMETEQYHIAEYWFETALNCNMDFRKGGFIIPDCYDYIPALQLCICCDRLGRYEEAEKYNELAESYKPDTPAVQFNRAYFQERKKQI